MAISKDEIIVYVKAYYRLNDQSPRLKDLPLLPFSKKRVVKLFGSWNRMLLNARLPLNRYPPCIIQCTNCKCDVVRQVKELRKTRSTFCSSACNAIYHNTGRNHSEETKSKISASLRAHRLFIES